MVQITKAEKTNSRGREKQVVEVERANDEGRECKRAGVQMMKGDNTRGREYESISGKRWKVEETEKILK